MACCNPLESGLICNHLEKIDILGGVAGCNPLESGLICNGVLKPSKYRCILLQSP